MNNLVCNLFKEEVWDVYPFGRTEAALLEWFFYYVRSERSPRKVKIAEDLILHLVSFKEVSEWMKCSVRRVHTGFTLLSGKHGGEEIALPLVFPLRYNPSPEYYEAYGGLYGFNPKAIHKLVPSEVLGTQGGVK